MKRNILETEREPNGFVFFFFFFLLQFDVKSVQSQLWLSVYTTGILGGSLVGVEHMDRITLKIDVLPPPPPLHLYPCVSPC